MTESRNNSNYATHLNLSLIQFGFEFSFNDTAAFNAPRNLHFANALIVFQASDFEGKISIKCGFFKDQIKLQKRENTFLEINELYRCRNLFFEIEKFSNEIIYNVKFSIYFYKNSKVIELRILKSLN